MRTGSRFVSLSLLSLPNNQLTTKQTEASTSSGWTKDDGSGESVGHESGRKIVDILRRNPEKDPEAFEEDDIQHMRKVVSYCKRHLAQEEKAKQNAESRSYRSLKNWGHDALKE